MVKPLPLAKLFVNNPAPAPSAGGAPPTPNFFVHNSPLPGVVPRGSNHKPAKPTGTYPKHWLKPGHAGYIAIHNAQRGIAPPTPNVIPNTGGPPKPL